MYTYPQKYSYIVKYTRERIHTSAYIYMYIKYKYIIVPGFHKLVPTPQSHLSLNHFYILVRNQYIQRANIHLFSRYLSQQYMSSVARRYYETALPRLTAFLLHLIPLANN